jgi:hypothetical protein
MRERQISLLMESWRERSDMMHVGVIQVSKAGVRLLTQRVAP